MPPSIKILTWNIQHGGARRVGKIIEALANHKPDIILLTEFRLKHAHHIQSALAEQGWRHQISSNPADLDNGLLLASRIPLNNNACKPPPHLPHRWIEAFCPQLQLWLLGIHVPGSGDKWDKKSFWEDIIKFGANHRSDHALILGDFNTGFSIDTEGTPFSMSEQMQMLLDQGWGDTWRIEHPQDKDFTWYSRRPHCNGFRLDYIFASPSLQKHCLGTELSHQERIESISDHSLVVMRLDTGYF